MDVSNAQLICVKYLSSKEVPDRVKRAMETVLQNLGRLQRFTAPQRPAIIDDKDCCPWCDEVLDTVAKRRVCPNCGKAINWSEIDWGNDEF